MNSYQKRLQNIKYLEQCISDMEKLCLLLAEKAPKPLLLPLSLGNVSDSLIMELLTKNQA